MSNLDKEFNERFQYQKSSSDDDEIGDIWDAVEKELDEESKDRPFFYLFSGLLGVSFLLFLLVGMTYWLVSSNAQEVAISNDVIDENVVSELTAVEDIWYDLPINDEIKPDIQKAKPEINQIEDNSRGRETSLSGSNKTEFVFDENDYTELKKEEAETPENKFLAKIDIHSENSSSITKEVERLILNSEILESEGVLVNGSSDSSSSRDDKILPSPFIDVKKFTVKNNEKLIFDFDILPLQQDAIKLDSVEDKKSKNIAFALGLTGGINRSNPSYKNSNNSVFSTLRNSTESGDFGQTYGLETIVTLKDRWIIQSGFEYHNFWTKFDYLNTDTEEVLIQNQLRKVWLDGTDTLSAEYGDVLIDRTTTREVIHHNQFTQISIPLELGFKNTTEKFTYGMTFGAAFNFLLNQSGKVFDETSEITEYDNESVIKPLSDFNLGLRLSPFVGYHLSEKVILGLKPNLMLQQTKGDVQTNLSTSVRSIGLKIGLQVGL